MRLDVFKVQDVGKASTFLYLPSGAYCYDIAMSLGHARVRGPI